MNMQSKIFLTFVITVGVLMAGCGGTETTVNVANTSTVNTNTPPPAVNSAPLEPVKKQEAATVNNAPTLTPVVHAYYDALKKKDDAAMRQVLASNFLKSLESDMKEENKTGLAAFLAETDQVPEKPMEVRNEKIEGTKGVAEVKGGTYLTFVAIAFVNEGGKWKMSNETPSLKLP